MTKRKTHFEQVPLEIARKIAAEEAKRKEAKLKVAGSKRKSRAGFAPAASVVSTGASL
ncbi:MAG: hypothetical protein WCA00_15590 [Candidatus Acidiferrales bacterium]